MSTEIDIKDAIVVIKVCKRCDDPKPITLFSSRSHVLKDGTKVKYNSPYCNKCTAKANKKSQTRSEEIIKRNKEYQREYHKKYIHKSK